MKTIISNEKTYVTLAKKFTMPEGLHGSYEKGRRFNAAAVDSEGLPIVCGHGMSVNIPHEYLGKYTKVWDEVTIDGNTKTITKKRADVTDEWRKELAEAVDADKAMEERRKLKITKREIAHLRKTIKFVKSGAAETELNKLLKTLKH